jgi:hypothetical protein
MLKNIKNQGKYNIMSEGNTHHKQFGILQSGEFKISSNKTGLPSLQP